MADSCATCFYFSTQTVNDATVHGSRSLAVCRKFAPQYFPVPAAGLQKAQWPQVDAHDWCGEFTASDPGIYTSIKGSGYTASSSDTLTLSSTADYDITTQTSLAYTEGARVRLTSLSSGKWMEGVCSGYDLNILSVAMDLKSGDGDYSDWHINLSGEPGRSAFPLITTVTAVGPQASLDLTGMTSAFDVYMVMLDGVRPATNGADLWLRVSTDNGANWRVTNYNDAVAGMANTRMTMASSVLNTAGYGVNSSIYLTSVNSNVTRKTITGTSSYMSSLGNVQYLTVAGLWDSNSAINAVQVLFGVGNVAGGRARLYGISV